MEGNTGRGEGKVNEVDDEGKGRWKSLVSWKGDEPTRSLRCVMIKRHHGRITIVNVCEVMVERKQRGKIVFLAIILGLKCCRRVLDFKVTTLQLSL